MWQGRERSFCVAPGLDGRPLFGVLETFKSVVENTVVAAGSGGDTTSRITVWYTGALSQVPSIPVTLHFSSLDPLSSPETLGFALHWRIYSMGASASALGSAAHLLSFKTPLTLE